MKSISFPVIRALAVCALIAMMAAAVPALVQDKSKDKAPQASKAEDEALSKIQTAPDVAAKIQAASEFIKKYPKSTRRAEVASYLAGEISKGQDAAVRITQLESLQTVFKEPADADVILPILIDAYVAAKRTDDAFRMASTMLAKNPNDVIVLTQMALVGIEEAKRQNPKFVQQSMQYGAKAIELIEANKKPEMLDAARWSDYQTKWLAQLYQSLGLVSLMMRNPVEAKAKLEKASSVNPNDPFTAALIASLENENYQKLAEEYKMMNAGPMKDDKLKQAQAKLDEVIELYARAVGLAQNKPEYKALHDQILEDLTTYYKYRHSNSTDGLQQLIDKYKKP